MINFFDKLYSSIKSENKILDKIKFYSLLRYCIRNIANWGLPLYFKLTADNPNYSLPVVDTQQKNRIIVSLTSFPARIDKIWLVIETILRQSYKPNMVILWLSEKQFCSIKSLPPNLLKLQKRGLQIELCPDDLRSHKKYYYTLQRYPEDIMITIDDDIFYNTKTIETLVRYSRMYPNHTIANVCKRISLNSQGEISPYESWDIEDKTVVDKYVIGIGAGGILYPSGVLSPVVENKAVFMDICRDADDIWLYFMTLLNSHSCIKAQTCTINPLPVLHKNNVDLYVTNLMEGKNNEQLKKILDYCIIVLKKDPFVV